MKSVEVIFSDDPAEKPTVHFQGVWCGRDIAVTKAALEKGYTLMKKRELNESKAKEAKEIQSEEVIEIGG